MVSLWGSRKNQEQGGTDNLAPPPSDGASNSHSQSQDIREPDERTRLLAHTRPHHSNGPYLDPDDPAVCVPLQLKLLSLF